MSIILCWISRKPVEIKHQISVSLRDPLGAEVVRSCGGAGKNFGWLRIDVPPASSMRTVSIHAHAHRLPSWGDKVHSLQMLSIGRHSWTVSYKVWPKSERRRRRMRLRLFGGVLGWSWFGLVSCSKRHIRKFSFISCLVTVIVRFRLGARDFVEVITSKGKLPKKDLSVCSTWTNLLRK